VSQTPQIDWNSAAVDDGQLTVPVSGKPSPAYPDYRVTCAGVEVGAGWNNINQTTKQPYVSLNLSHPDIGPRTYKVNLGRAAGQDDDDVFALIWNAED